MKSNLSQDPGAVKSRLRYAENPEYFKNWKKRWINKNPEKHRLNRIRYRSSPHTRATEMLSAAKWSSKKKGHAVTITHEWITERLSSGKCELTGIEFDLRPLPGGRQNPYTASLDRKDCSLGYTPENTRVILWALNAAFNTYGEAVYAKIAAVYLQQHPCTGTGLT